MKKLYAPWRDSYAGATDKTKEENAQSHECVFCEFITENNDEKNFILQRSAHCFVILNKYPYNAGHLMVLPLKHTKNLADLSKEARHEIIDVIDHCMTSVEKVLKAEGLNIGLNIGRASGAGIPSHMHWHILPRWNGDTNFLPALADVKVVSFDLKEIYDLLKPAFKNHTIS